MKRKSIFLAFAVLLLASLACNALGGGGSEGGDAPAAPSDSGAPQDSSSGGGNVDTSASGFPITSDAYNVVDLGDGNVLYYTKLPQADVLKFYRDEYVSRGYTERALLTVVEDSVFSVVFDGDPSGKVVVIQSVDLGDGSSTVAISLQDV
ncbi:MAG: hypothetical protein IT314_15480 [Anaerolineales bacterium]|nr:hypothetical protein [Anaerolineales bacterium]